MMIYTIITTSLSPIIKQNQALLTIPNRVFFEIGYTVYPWDVVKVLDFRGYFFGMGTMALWFYLLL